MEPKRPTWLVHPDRQSASRALRFGPTLRCSQDVLNILKRNPRRGRMSRMPLRGLVRGLRGASLHFEAQ